MAIRRKKVQREADHSAPCVRWQEHLGFINLNTQKKTLEATTQLYTSKKYIDSPKPLLENRMSKLPACKYPILNEGIGADIWFPKTIYGTSVDEITL